jgi:hypothetical protein
MEHKLPSGVMLDITLLDYEKAFAVFQTTVRQIGILDVDLSKIDLEKFAALDVMEFKRPLTQILSNSDLVKAGNQCLEKCTYDGIKVTTKTWESPEARKDYLFAIFYALKENCYPFVEGVFSGSAE